VRLGSVEGFLWRILGGPGTYVVPPLAMGNSVFLVWEAPFQVGYRNDSARQYGSLRGAAITRLELCPEIPARSAAFPTHPRRRDRGVLGALKWKLDVNRNEVLGIIGRNGPGKSMLLVILSSISEPSDERVILFDGSPTYA
jgi:ABC-type multidrug transport system fused ATPase/permease subunit